MYEEKHKKVNKLFKGKNDKYVETEHANAKTNPIVMMQESYMVIFENYLDQVPHQQIHISKKSEYQTEISSKRLMNTQQFRVEDVLE